MIIVDNKLQEREREGRPIRVGMVGAGFMGQGLTNQIVNSVPGMSMAAIYNRTPERAEGVYRYSGVDDVVHVDTQAAFEDAVRAGRGVVADDPMLLCHSDQIDVLIDVTGSVEFGANVFIEAFKSVSYTHLTLPTILRV